MNPVVPAPLARAELRAALFTPRRIALVGASSDPAKASSRPLKFLRTADYPVQLSVVNRRGEHIDGTPVYRSLEALPDVPDHVFVMTPTAGVLEIVEQCASLGVKVATILSSGFAEAGPDGEQLQRRLVDAARAGSVRLLGPSSLGLVNLRRSLRLTGNAVFADTTFPVGGTFVASQSGSLIGALVSRGAVTGMGFSAVVSVGGEADLSIGEICSLSLDDETVTGYALFLETIRHSDTLSGFAREAAARGKPVVAYKIGRSRVAAQLATSHTGALAGEDDVAGAFLRGLGIARVHSLNGLLEAQPLMRRIPARATTQPRPRVAVVTTTGGGGAMLVDQLTLRGVSVCPPSAETRAKLTAAGVSAAPAVIVDLTLAGTRYEVMRATLDVLLGAPEFDLVIAVIGSSARIRPDLAVSPIVDAADRTSRLATFLVPDAPQAAELLRSADIPTFTSPETCADVVAAAIDRQVRLPPSPVVVASAPPVQLDEAQSYEVLAGVGIASAPHAVVDIDGLRPGVLPPFDYPVAVKMLDAGVPHKSDLGGVVLGVRTADELLSAARLIRSRAGSGAEGRALKSVLVQQMVSGIGEFLIGYRVDLQVGPIVLLAAGGTNAELYRDRSVRLAPVDPATAAQMVDDIAAARALAGIRNAPPGDRGALEAAIVALSTMALDDRVVEAEVNPLIVYRAGRGASAVDAVVTLRGVD